VFAGIFRKEGSFFHFLFGMPPYNAPTQRPPPRNEFVLWVEAIPPVTRAILGASIVFPLAGAFGVVNMSNLLLLWKPVLEKFQVSTSFVHNTLDANHSC
jgi:hypothetical protein